jgi:hypothetical protein
MVIGDSLAQGCRSLTVTADYCAAGWPAQLARSQGWPFVTPDFPRPVLFDLEAEVRRLDTLTLSVQQFRFSGFETRFRQNLGEWLVGAVESAQPCFDNLALSGALVNDVYTRSAQSSAAELAALTPNGATSALALSKIGDLHLAIDGAFVLNPSHDPAFAGFTPLDWVRARVPEVLVVQHGHNHGLYRVGSDAVAVPVDQGDSDHGSYWTQWGEVANQLAALPPEVETILVALLPKVSAVANLRPQGTDRDAGYAVGYEPVLSGSPAVLTGPELAGVDASIRTANDRIRTTILAAATTAGTAGRIKFLDLYAHFDGFDYKNSLDPARRIDVGNGVVVDNRYLDTALVSAGHFHLPRRGIVAGGLQSIDGMHPSACGYALVADAALTALGLPHDRADLLARGFGADALLTNTPLELGIIVRLLHIAQDVQRANHFIPQLQTFLSDNLLVTDALNMMKQVFRH